MIDVNSLKGIIVAKGYTGADVAKVLNITPKTFYEKMKKGVFNSDEIETMISFLNITNTVQVFFAPNVTQQETNV